MPPHATASDAQRARRFSTRRQNASNIFKSESFARSTRHAPAIQSRLLVLAAGLVLLLLAPSQSRARTVALHRHTDVRDEAWASPGPQQQSEKRAQPQPASIVARTQQNSLSPETGTVSGTVIDVNGDPVGGALVVLQGPAVSDRRTATTNANGFYEIADVTPGIPYRMTVSAAGFASWTSPAIVLAPGQYKIVSGGPLRVQEVRTTVTVSPETAEQIAIQQVKIEETQRGFGVIPNFYEAFEPNPEPLTAKLKFKLAVRYLRDPVTVAGTGVLTASAEAAGIPRFEDGVEGLGQRLAANYTNQATDIMLGDAVLPSLFHQDPRYFYQGTGRTKSRLFHAISAVFVAKGDNGSWQPNYSGMGGDLASAAIANLYYPRSNGGLGLVFQNFGINTGIHMASRVMEEFLFHPPH